MQIPFATFLALSFSGLFASASEPYLDRAFTSGPQKIPGPVFCAYFDKGGEGVAYHDSDTHNSGSGALNPANGTYLNEFRIAEALDVSYTKQIPDLESSQNKVVPPLGLLYVGWNEPGEWFNITVEIAESGRFTADLLYTAQRDGKIGVSVDGGEASTFGLAATSDPAETIPWRQWHHWNVLKDAVTISLPKGRSVLTIRIMMGGNCNLATFAFRPADKPFIGAKITELKTAVP